MSDKIKTGRMGEEKAVEFLRKNGYSILERNFRNIFGEIDIVASHNGVICFVEVRSRRGSSRHAEALGSIGFLKQRKLSKLAISFLKEKKWQDRKARFDVVSVSLAEPENSIMLLKDAFCVTQRYA
jgi:putative endonuclease